MLQFCASFVVVVAFVFSLHVRQQQALGTKSILPDRVLLSFLCSIKWVIVIDYCRFHTVVTKTTSQNVLCLKINPTSDKGGAFDRCDANRTGLPELDVAHLSC